MRTLRRIKRLIILILCLGVIAGAGGAAFVYYGVYNVSALAQHTAPIYKLLQYAMVRAVATRSPDQVPELEALDWQGSGIRLYDTQCRQCHGAPGSAPEPFSLGMMPAPTAIAEIARARTPADSFWAIKHGIKMTGMPAWSYRMTDEQIWQVVAFIEQIPNLTVAEYRRLRNRQGANAPAEPAAWPASTGGAKWIEKGRIALQQYNCSSCHVIPGITGADNHVGPPLGSITRRAFIAGLMQYSDENLVHWIRFPDEVDPQTTMPDLGVTATHARAMVAYLKSLESE